MHASFTSLNIDESTRSNGKHNEDQAQNIKKKETYQRSEYTAVYENEQRLEEDIWLCLG